MVEDGCWILNSYGDKCWYKYGKLHRADGPAVEGISGCKRYYYKEFWIDGKRQD